MRMTSHVVIDTKPIEDATTRATHSMFSRFGFNVRSGTRQKLKYGTGTSTPGQPPIIHRRMAAVSKRRRNRKPAKPQQSSPYRDGILYFASPMEAIVGFTNLQQGGKSVGKALEDGGVSTRVDGTKIRVEPRPALKPVFYENLLNVGAMLQDSIY